MIVGGQTEARVNYYGLSSTIVDYHGPLDQGRVVGKQLNANPRLNVKLKHYFFLFKTVFHLQYLVWFEITTTQN